MVLLVTGAWKEAQMYVSVLESKGHQVYFMQNEIESLPCASDVIEGVICNGLFLHHDIQTFTNLKYIQLTSAGLDRVPMEYIRSHNITINNARGVYSIPMAEYAICGVLQLYKKVSSFYENKKMHLWEKNRNLFELYGKQVCIVGCGSVGTECAKRFKAFGCIVRGIDEVRDGTNNCFDEILQPKHLQSELSQADVVVLTLPLTEETKGMFGHEMFQYIKTGAIFVNIARGLLVNEQALVKALKNHLMGAVLDVFEQEPLSVESAFWDMDNVIITPHNSFVSDGNDRRLGKIIMDNLDEQEEL